MLRLLQDQFPAHMGAGSIAVLILCGLIVAALGTNAILRWKTRRATRRAARRYGRVLW